MNQDQIVDGFVFESADVYEKAKKEKEGVRYMKSRIDLSHPMQVLQIYKKMIEQEMFQTPVGQAYLMELQDYLQTMPQVDNDQIPPVIIRDVVRVMDASGTTEALREELKKSRNRCRFSVIGNLVAAAVIIVMFAIAASSSSPTILNYENKLIDKYSTWEQELSAREDAIREKESALNGEAD